ncbi:MAG: energy-coupling factor transporter transmembrane protein EcfT [Flavobacteriaceae bacterium]|nr:energy-coupling factor transporter transmembrane protein EcfT [Flavobacteriaceae bacterium]
MLTSLYVDKNSFIHKLSPSLKILFLLFFCTFLFVFEHWALLIPTAILVVFLYSIARIEPLIIWESIKPILWVLGVILVAQYFLSGINLALFVVLRLLVILLIASLVTLTTKISDLIEGIEAGLRHLPKQVLTSQISLAISLCIRFIPQVRNTLEEVRNAQKARGLGRDWKALAVPTVVRTLKSADEISEAIIARSMGQFNKPTPDKLQK